VYDVFSNGQISYSSGISVFPLGIQEEVAAVGQGDSHESWWEERIVLADLTAASLMV
jgi:hypothetical protein